MQTPYKNLIPALSPEEYKGLEKSCIEQGMLDDLIVWGDILLDGHNRYEISQKNNIPYSIQEIDPEVVYNDKTARIWICKYQLNRRNLNNYQRSVLALQLEELLKPIAKEKQISKLKQGDKLPAFLKSEKREIPINITKELAKTANVGHDTISKVKLIEKMAEPEIKEKLKAGNISINQVHKEIVREQKREEKKNSLQVIPIPQGKYTVIYADPPWKYDFAETKNRDIENQYPTMTLPEIKELDIPADDNSVLFLWATAPKLIEALEVMRAWGFSYKTNAIWDKQIIGMGYWFRGQHEILLIGVKGKFSPPDPEFRFSSVYCEKRTAHSKKPDYYYAMIEKMCPNQKYIELFSRNKINEKWEVWGNE